MILASRTPKHDRGGSRSTRLEEGNNLAVPAAAGGLSLVNGQIQYVPARALTSEPTRTPDADFASRLDRFRRELRALGHQPSRSDVERLQLLASELNFRDEEIRDELAEIRAASETIDFADRLAREGLPIVESLERLQPHERSHFVTPVRFGRRRSDQCGHLELTSDRLRFHGALDVSVVWSEIAAVERAGHEIVVSLANSRRVLRFSCYAATEAARGALLVRHLTSADAAREGEDGGAFRPAV